MGNSAKSGFYGYDRAIGNIRERLKIAVDALEEIQHISAFTTEDEKRISMITVNALVKIYKLLIENTQD